MKLRNARIENYRAIDNLELSFVNSRGAVRPITVLAGPNGSGKTSILFAITNALRGPLGYRAEEVPEPDSDDIRLASVSRTAWAKSIPEIRVSLELQFDEQERQAIPELLKIVGMQPPPPLDDGILTVQWVFPPKIQPDGMREEWWMVSIDPPLQHVRSWLSARRLAIKAWRDKVPGMSPELLDSIGGLFFFPQDRNLTQRVLGLGVEPVGAEDHIPRGDDIEQASRLTSARPIVVIEDRDFRTIEEAKKECLGET